MHQPTFSILLTSVILSKSDDGGLKHLTWLILTASKYIKLVILDLFAVAVVFVIVVVVEVVNF